MDSLESRYRQLMLKVLSWMLRFKAERTKEYNLRKEALDP